MPLGYSNKTGQKFILIELYGFENIFHFTFYVSWAHRIEFNIRPDKTKFLIVFIHRN